MALKSKAYLRKFKAANRKEALKKARRDLAPARILKVRTIKKAIKKGTFWVQGIAKPRKRASKLGRRSK